MWWDVINFKSNGDIICGDEVFCDDMTSELLQVWADITEILSKYLDLPIADHEMLAASALIGNPYEGNGEIWSKVAAKYGTIPPAGSVKRLEEARSQLAKMRVHQDRGGAENPATLEEVRCAVLEASGALWKDIRFRVLRSSRDELETTVDLLIGYLEAEKGTAGKNAEKHHPYSIAISLRCVFEKFSSKPIRSGFAQSADPSGSEKVSSEAVTGLYANCLKELYKLLNVKGSPRYYAQKAKACTDADDHYREIRENLAIASEKMREFRHLFESNKECKRYPGGRGAAAPTSD